jgi:hypothetical protein
MKQVSLLLSLSVGLVLADSDGWRRAQHWVKPRFECYDGENAWFGYVAKTNIAGETAFSLPYSFNGVPSTTDMTFLAGCYSKAFSQRVTAPAKPRTKVLWQVGAEVASVNFRKQCTPEYLANRRRDDTEEECPRLDRCATAFSACPNTLCAAPQTRGLVNGVCSCLDTAALTISVPLRPKGEQEEAFLSAFGITVQDVSTLLNQDDHSIIGEEIAFKEKLASLFSVAVDSIIQSCLLPDDVTIHSIDASASAQTLIAEAVVTIQVSDLGTYSVSSLSDLIHQELSRLDSTGSNFDTSMTIGEAMLCRGNNNLRERAASGSLNTEPCAPIVTLWGGTYDSVWQCEGTNGLSITHRPSEEAWDLSCPPQPTGSLTPYVGPVLFSRAGVNGFWYLLDEQGRPYSSGDFAFGQPRSAESYLALSPTYVVVAIAVVLALALGSVVGVVIYRRRQAASADFTLEAPESGWVSGQKLSSGRTRAGGL